MSAVERTVSSEQAARERLSEPRADCLVLEREVAPGRFEAVEGPYRRYQRTLTTAGGEVTERTEFRLAVALWPMLFTPLFRSALRRRLPPGKVPWWAPSDRVDPTSGTVLGLLCCASLITGYLGTLITQTITFAADEFSSSDSAQGATLAAVRVGVLGSVAIAALADRAGRRRALLWSMTAA